MKKGINVLGKGTAMIMAAALVLSQTMPVNVLAKDKVSKEETVYVNAGANGDVEKVTVSARLKNQGDTDVIEDYTNLKNIQNVKGDETFTQAGDGSLTWTSEGEDIFYQGETDESLPVDVKVSYYLDGKKMSPEEMAGKSGDVKIRFDYTNHSREKVKVDGKEIEVTTPFTMITAMILPSDVFSEVEVKNGRVVSDGDKNIAVGMALPGLRDSLKLETVDELNDIDIPEYVEVTAHAEKFELALTATAAMTGNLDEAKLDKIDSLDDLKEDIEDLTDASEQLVEGTGELAEGMDSMQSSLKTYTDGVDSANQGAKELAKGLKTLNANKKDLKKGTDSLTSGLKELKTGTKNLKAGINKYTKGASTLDEGIGAAAQGAASLQTGAQVLSQSLTQYTAGVKKLQQGISQMSETLSGSAEAIGKASAAAEGLAANAKKLEGEVSKLNGEIEKLSSLSNNLSSYQSKVESWVGGVADAAEGINSKAEEQADAQATEKARAAAKQAVSDAVSGMELPEEDKNKIINSVSDITVSGIDIEADGEVKSALKNFPTFDMPQISMDVDGISSLLTEMEQQSKALSGLSGISSMTGGVQELKDGADNLAANNKALLAGMKELKTGIDTLSGAMTKLEKGASELTGNNKDLTDGAGSLDTGAGKLYTGSKKLDAGVKKANEAIALLTKGSVNLSLGTDKLADAGTQVNSGADKLAQGASELDDGMNEFDEEGISQIADLAGDDVENVVNHLKAVKKADQNYQTFGGIKEGEKGSVKFLIETAPIETEDE